jgi:hypothetical protein
MTDKVDFLGSTINKNQSILGRTPSGILVICALKAALEDQVPEIEQTALQHRTLGAIADHVGRLDAVRKADLEFGDRIFVITRNSIYSIHVLHEDLYSVSGGWFDKKGLSPSKVAINGCTWGGRAIKWDIVAACGLHLEFGNQVVTSRIMELQVIRCREDFVN